MMSCLFARRSTLPVRRNGYSLPPFSRMNCSSCERGSWAGMSVCSSTTLAMTSPSSTPRSVRSTTLVPREGISSRLWRNCPTNCISPYRATRLGLCGWDFCLSSLSSRESSVRFDGSSGAGAAGVWSADVSSAGGVLSGMSETTPTQPRRPAENIRFRSPGPYTGVQSARKGLPHRSRRGDVETPADSRRARSSNDASSIHAAGGGLHVGNAAEMWPALRGTLTRPPRRWQDSGVPRGGRLPSQCSQGFV